jgi:hypothetical protein
VFIILPAQPTPTQACIKETERKKREAVHTFVKQLPNSTK